MTDHLARQIMDRAKANEYYRRAVETPEYVATVELREQALREKTQLPGVAQPPMPSTGDEIAEWLDAIVEADAAQQARERRIAALTSLLIDCDRAILAAAGVDPNRLLRTLSAEMDALMREVAQAVEQLNGARTPSEVIAADVGGAWKALVALRQSYDKIRDAQTFMMLDYSEWIASRSNYIDDPHASDCYIRNLDEVFPSWREKDRATIVLNGNEPDPRPWPTEPTAQLVWLSSSDAEVWVPTRKQLNELHAERQRRRNPPPKAKPQRPPFKQTYGRGRGIVETGFPG